ncbi:MAG: hypothetical protein AB7F22_24600 [Reyranella sp.]|uniref:hypothetical protein n=1 Tax=Reyranella sp. TaxID=1929291 RepID=UPI003D0E7566
MPKLENWKVDSDAVWHERIGSHTVALRHPAYPVEKDSWNGTPAALRLFVAHYLTQVAPALGLPVLFVGDTDDFRVPLAWLKLPNEGDLNRDPRRSFWVSRFRRGFDGSGLLDRTVVLLASVTRSANDGDGVLGGRLGLRVVAHVTPPGIQPRTIRITSVARSLDLPKVLVAQPISPTVQKFYNALFDDKSNGIVPSSLGHFAGLNSGASGSLDGVRVTSEAHNNVGAELYATVARPTGNPQGLAYAVTVRVTFDGHTIIPHEIDRRPLVAHAAPPVSVGLFTTDPASKAGPGRLIDARPNRSGARLDRYTENNIRLDGLELDNYGDARLEDDRELVRVLQSKLVDPDADESATEVDKPRDAQHPRTPAFAAFSGYERGRAQFDQRRLRPVFDTVAAYGLRPYGYFRFADNPVHVRYRSPIIPGPGKDGKTVNAQVILDSPRANLIASTEEWVPAILRSPEVRFALADLKRTSARRDALGLGADPRWSWHEYCHVLLGGQTGRLELHFAHSAGDAMAAIACDPSSELARSPWTRGYTFPWVYLHRRHDRRVEDGWGWCGRRHRPNRFVWPDSNSRHKGYESEQILSTSLFRLYRALGGDTDDEAGSPDEAARQRAADYALYLILRAISLMPAHHVGLLETPDQLVTTLVEADIATLPAPNGPLRDRVGGWAHKVIRWAFEAQGLYATDDPEVIVEAPGLPPPVDIFIDTQRRPQLQGPLSRGGYQPVSLRWNGPGEKPWHASAEAIHIDSSGIRVAVRNRGNERADEVTVSLWCKTHPSGAAQPPTWDGSWTCIGNAGPITVPAWPAEAVSVGPFAQPAPPSSGHLWILAIAHCPGDPANTDPGTLLPTANTANRPSIVDLVAGDNNLGLRVI